MQPHIHRGLELVKVKVPPSTYSGGEMWRNRNFISESTKPLFRSEMSRSKKNVLEYSRSPFPPPVLLSGRFAPILSAAPPPMPQLVCNISNVRDTGGFATPSGESEREIEEQD